MFGRARKTQWEILQGVMKREKEERQGNPREDPYQPGTQPSWGDRRILRAHPLPEPTRARLASNGSAVIVSLGFLEDHAESLTATHFHIHPTEPEIGLIHSWTKVELMAAFHPSVVISFDNINVKDRALAQLHHSWPLKTLALLDESLRAFFWYKGYIYTRDLITEQVRGMTKRKVLIKNNRCLDWVQKCTVIKGGNGDQEIPAEPVETCSICPRTQKHQPLVRENVVLDNWGIPRQISEFPDHLRSASASKLPVRRDGVPNDRNAAKPPALRSQDKEPPMASHTLPTQRPVDSANILHRTVLRNIVANNGNGPRSNQVTHRHAYARDAFRTPARASIAPMGASTVKAPSRKVMPRPVAILHVLIVLASEPGQAALDQTYSYHCQKFLPEQ